MCAVLLKGELITYANGVGMSDLANDELPSSYLSNLLLFIYHHLSRHFSYHKICLLGRDMGRGRCGSNPKREKKMSVKTRSLTWGCIAYTPRPKNHMNTSLNGHII